MDAPIIRAIPSAATDADSHPRIATAYLSIGRVRLTVFRRIQKQYNRRRIDV